MKSVEDILARAAEKQRAVIELARKNGKDWRRTVGWAKDDPIYDEAMRLGAQWRAEVNRKSLEEMDRSDVRP